MNDLSDEGVVGVLAGDPVRRIVGQGTQHGGHQQHHHADQHVQAGRQTAQGGKEDEARAQERQDVPQEQLFREPQEKGYEQAQAEDHQPAANRGLVDRVLRPPCFALLMQPQRIAQAGQQAEHRRGQVAQHGRHGIEPRSRGLRQGKMFDEVELDHQQDGHGAQNLDRQNARAHPGSGATGRGRPHSRFRRMSKMIRTTSAASRMMMAISSTKPWRAWRDSPRRWLASS